MKNASTAKLGNVCMMFAIPIIIDALFFIRVNKMPSGTATSIPRNTAIIDIYNAPTPCKATLANSFVKNRAMFPSHSPPKTSQPFQPLDYLPLPRCCRTRCQPM